MHLSLRWSKTKVPKLTVVEAVDGFYSFYLFMTDADTGSKLWGKATVTGKKINFFGNFLRTSKNMEEFFKKQDCDLDD